jgi:hypothetical protein
VWSGTARFSTTARKRETRRLRSASPSKAESFYRPDREDYLPQKKSKRTIFFGSYVFPKFESEHADLVLWPKTPFSAPARHGVQNYNRHVARGWESKSVEAQQAEAGAQPGKRSKRMSASESALLRETESLRLCRQRVIQQMQVSQNPRHRAVLEQALADLDTKLKALEQSNPEIP